MAGGEKSIVDDGFDDVANNYILIVNEHTQGEPNQCDSQAALSKAVLYRYAVGG